MTKARVEYDLFGIVERSQAALSDHYRVARAGELLAAFELTMLGADVSVASEGRSYDLLADINGKVWRIQVKTATKTSGKGFRFSLHHGSHKADKRSTHYTEEHMDAFAFVAATLRRVMFVPLCDVQGIGSIDVQPSQFTQSDDIAAISFARTFTTKR